MADLRFRHQYLWGLVVEHRHQLGAELVERIRVKLPHMSRDEIETYVSILTGKPKVTQT